jgi:hypothetical protein
MKIGHAFEQKIHEPNLAHLAERNISVQSAQWRSMALGCGFQLLQNTVQKINKNV